MCYHTPFEFYPNYEIFERRIVNLLFLFNVNPYLYSKIFFCLTMLFHRLRVSYLQATQSFLLPVAVSHSIYLLSQNDMKPAPFKST